ncbi:hypothetical protein [Paradesulfitobacterium ferrireducens]|uniref:hypothetical protein n=1 Tax=Paradesulfitobacterium ferrireducens TaxID=2816476 RepID=UPI001A8F1BC1|nr:hypothetical protein [Paradesulfitobacterium ferrireducens]
MNKVISADIAITACVILCAAVWPRSYESRDVPAETVKTGVNTKIAAKPGEVPQLIISVENNAPEPEPAVEIEPIKQAAPVIVDSSELSQPAKSASKSISLPVQPSADLKPGSKTVIDDKPYIWIPGFGWIEDHCGGSVGITVNGEGDINKQVGGMGGGTTVGNPGDELTGHKVGIMGGGTVAEDMYENGNKIDIIGGDDSHSEKSASPTVELPESEGEAIYIEFMEKPKKTVPLRIISQIQSRLVNSLKIAKAGASQKSSPTDISLRVDTKTTFPEGIVAYFIGKIDYGFFWRVRHTPA